MIKIHTLIKGCILIGLSFGINCSFAADNIMVFATSNQQITGIPNTYKRCNLDTLQIIQTQMNQSIANLTTQNMDLIQRKVNQYSQQLTQAMNCLVEAKQDHITKLPAIVINEKVVVYGEYDVPAAIVDGASSLRGKYS